MQEPVYHLALATQWDEALAVGTYRWSTRGLTIDEVGYLHAAHPHQLDGVAERFYSDVDEPLLRLTLDVADLESRGFKILEEPGDPGDPESEKFPHLHGGLLPVEGVSAVDPYVVPGRNH